MFERIETPRLILRRPVREDAPSIYTRYASDPNVTRLLSWPTHTSLAATHAFLDFSDAAWAQWPVGPYLIESRQDGSLLGSSGLAFETGDRAATGYVLAKDSWGRGYATESVRAVTGVARQAGVVRLYALCHPENMSSQRVLEKCGFEREGLLRRHSHPQSRPQFALRCLLLCLDSRPRSSTFGKHPLADLRQRGCAAPYDAVI